MPEYIVTRKSDGAEMIRYSSSQIVERINEQSYPVADYDHTELNPDDVQTPVDPTRWRIYVGNFFDRFGASKLAILSDPDPVVQAVIKDASVRNYIDLLGRRDELLQVIGLLNLKGHAVDATAVLDVEPNEDEVWRG